MNRYYIHEWTTNNAILIDTVNNTWTFYNSNIYGQVYNLDEQPKKITKQRINGLMKRLQKYYDSYNGYVVDQYIYNYIMTNDQRESCKYSVDLQKDLITSGDDLKEVLTAMCKHCLEQYSHADKEDTYYINHIEKLVS